MAYTTIDNPELFFQTVLYSGNATARSITLDGSEDMQPDWVWIKGRTTAYNNTLFDSVRGATKRLYSNGTDAESTQTVTLTSFDSDGFSLGNNASVNSATSTFVAWNWKAGGSASSNTDGTNITSTVSANTTAGFSIVSYTGSGTISDTVGHGLGTTPNWIILKNRDTGTSAFIVHHSALSSGYNMQLQSNGDHFNSTGQGHLGTVGSSTFGFVAGSSGNDQVNDSSEKYIAYCFVEKKGYSKFGKYRGNGNADGPFVYTGFKPAWVILKEEDGTSDWSMYDNKREPFNLADSTLEANTSDAEAAVSGRPIDILSNSFKLRGDSSYTNESGKTYIYMAFAESPFVNSSGIPNNAR